MTENWPPRASAITAVQQRMEIMELGRDSIETIMLAAARPKEGLPPKPTVTAREPEHVADTDEDEAVSMIESSESTPFTPLGHPVESDSQRPRTRSRTPAGEFCKAYYSRGPCNHL